MPFEGAEMSDAERIRKLKKMDIEHDKIKESEIKNNFWREYLTRTKLIMNSTLN